MTPVINIKVTPKPILRGRMDVRFPASILTEYFLTTARANGTYTLTVDYTLLPTDFSADPALLKLAVLDQSDGLYKIASVAALVAGATQIDQEITAAGPAPVLPNAGIVRVNQTVGAAITLNMPAASAKTCPVLISDWKGDAGTNNITINLTGSDKFPGGLTSWVIGADTGSVFLRPIAGVGYAL